MDPVVYSSLFQAGANVLSGLMGGKAKRPKPSETSEFIIGHRKYDSYLDKLANQLGFTQTDVGSYIKPHMAQILADHEATRGKMASFKLNGIHPIYGLGLGGSLSSSPSYQVGAPVSSASNAGSIAAELGQGVAGAVAAHAGAGERAIAAKSAELMLEGQMLDNEYKRSQINLMNQPGRAMGINLSPAIPGQGNDPRYPNQQQMRLGFGDSAPFFREAVDANGDKIRVYNDDLGDNEILQAITGIGVSLHDIVRNAGRRTGRWLRDHVTW